MKALVIGGTGFVGLNIAAALKTVPGCEVAVTRRKSSNTIFARRLGVALRTVDFDDATSLVAAMDDSDVVFDASGYYPRFSNDPEKQIQHGVELLGRVLTAVRSRPKRRYIYTSSSATLGRPTTERPACEDDGYALAQGSTYFAIKIAMEQEVARAIESGLDGVILCPTGCLGPFDYKVGTGQIIAGTANGVLGAIVDGQVNMVDAGDMAMGHVRAATLGKTGERYILGGHNVRIKDFVRLVQMQLQVSMPIQTIAPAAALAMAVKEERRCLDEKSKPPLWSRKSVDMVLQGQFVDSSKAMRELGYTVRPLTDTIDRTLGWYRDNGYIAHQQQLKSTQSKQENFCGARQ